MCLFGYYKNIMYLCSVILRNVEVTEYIEMGKIEIEMRIKFLETVLAQYTRISDMSNISFYSQSETIDNYLDELQKLYIERDKAE